ELSRFDPGRSGHRTVNDDTAKETAQNAAAGVPDSVAAWEERYSESEDAVWSGNPNEALVATVGDMTPGRVLDVGCGEGADAIWLAEHGWTSPASTCRQRPSTVPARPPRLAESTPSSPSATSRPGNPRRPRAATRPEAASTSSPHSSSTPACPTPGRSC